MKSFFVLFLVVCSIFVTAFGVGIDADCKGGYHKGQGSAPKIYYYYDEGVKNCIQFVYFGSGGNKNRHDTRAQCKKVCKVPNARRLPAQTH